MERMEGIAAKLPSTQTNEELKKFIVSSKEEMWKDKGFLPVVNAYLESSKRSVDFYVSVWACIIWGRETILMIEYVILLYEREVKKKSGEESRCSRMLKDLLWLKSRGGYALGERFARVIRSVYEKEEENSYMRVLEEIEKAEATTVGSTSTKENLLTLYRAAESEQRVVLDTSNRQIRQLVKKPRRIKRLRIVSNIMFAIGFFTVPVLTFLVMFLPIPSAIEVLVGAFSATIGSIGKWWSYILIRRENAALFQKEGLLTITKGSYVLLKDMEAMHKLVEKMFLKIEILVLVLKYMRSGKIPEGEMKDDIEKIMLELHRMFNDVEEHSCMGHCTIAYASNLVSERLSSVTTPISTSKRQSWIDIFK